MTPNLISLSQKKKKKKKNGDQIKLIIQRVKSAVSVVSEETDIADERDRQWSVDTTYTTKTIMAKNIVACRI